MTRVALLDTSAEDRWEHFVDTHPQAGLYHSLAWRTITVEGFGHTPRYLYASDAADNVVGVLPLFQVKGMFGRRLVSVPMRDRGGPVGRDPGIEQELLRAAVQLSRDANAQYLEIRSLDPLDGASVEGLPLQVQQHWVTSRVDLRNGADAAWKALHQKVRQHVRRAESQGVKAEFDSSREATLRFFDAFVRARTDMGIPPFPRAFVEAVWQHLIRTGRANLIMATQGATLINGMINFLSKDTVIAAYSAPQRAWLKLYPAEVVYWNTIAWAARSGFATFDFGADSPQQEGLIAFKKKFGATSQVMSSYYFLHRTKAPPNFDSSTRSYALARRIWSFLPEPLSRVGGAWVTRRLS